MVLMVPKAFPVVYNGIRYRGGEVFVLERDVEDLTSAGWSRVGTTVPTSKSKKKKTKTKPASSARKDKG